MLKRDLSYELFSRELQALDELFSRGPEGWAEWAGSARDYYTAKREPSPGGMISKPDPKPTNQHINIPVDSLVSLPILDYQKTPGQPGWNPTPVPGKPKNRV